MIFGHCHLFRCTEPRPRITAAPAPVNHAADTPASGPAIMQNSSSLLVQKTAASKSQRADEFRNVGLQDPTLIWDFRGAKCEGKSFDLQWLVRS